MDNREGTRSIPTDSNGEGALVPVTAVDQGHFAVGVGSGAVEDFVGVAVFGGIEFVGVGVRRATAMAMGFGSCHRD